MSSGRGAIFAGRPRKVTAKSLAKTIAKAESSSLKYDRNQNPYA
jgi:hypothetical protein